MTIKRNDECPICTNGTFQPFCSATPLDYSQNVEYHLLECNACGHGVSNAGDQPEEEQLEAYNTGAYDPKEKFWHSWVKPLLSALELGKLSYMGRKGQGKRLLEIGSGKGRFLAAAKAHGYEVFGIEPSDRSAFFARKRLGEVIWSVNWANMDTVAELRQDFDGIYLWHVLEHLDEPNAALATFRKRLKPDGSIIIGVPNFASSQARSGKANWYHLDPSRHHQHFTPASLQALFERNGYHVSKRHFNSFYQDFMGELITTVNRVLPDKNVIFNVLRLNSGYFGKVGKLRAFLMFGLAGLLSALLAIPLMLWTLITQAQGKAGTMVFVAKPK